MRSISESGFEATLRLKPNVLSFWKQHFSLFCKFSIDVVETIFWESEAKSSKRFNFTKKNITRSLKIIGKNKAEASIKYYFYLKVLFKITTII